MKAKLSQEKKIEMFVTAIDKMYPSTKALILRSFIHGLFVGLGATVGVSLVLAVFTYMLSQLWAVPGLDRVIDQKKVEKALPDM